MRQPFPPKPGSLLEAIALWLPSANAGFELSSDRVNLFVGQFRKHGQREEFMGATLRHREGSLLAAQKPIGLLQVNRNGIMDRTRNAPVGQGLQDLISILHSRRINMKDVPVVRRFKGSDDLLQIAQELIIK